MGIITDNTFLAILAIVGTIFGISGIILTTIFFIKSKIRIIPIISYHNRNEVSKLSNANRKISVLFKNNQVPQVTTTVVWFWNKGKKPLKRDDIPLNEQITIFFEYFRYSDKELNTDEEINILDFNIIKTSRNSSNVKLIQGEMPNSLILDFDYFDNDDGVVFEVQHTGDANTTLRMDGVILGPKKKIKIHKISRSNYRIIKSDSNIKPEKGKTKKSSLKSIIINTLFIVFSISLISIGIVFGSKSEKTININRDKLLAYIEQSLIENNIQNDKIGLIINNISDKFEEKTNFWGIFIFSLIGILIIIFFVVYQNSKKLPDNLRLLTIKE
jgi:hypothetical protein